MKKKQIKQEHNKYCFFFLYNFYTFPVCDNLFVAEFSAICRVILYISYVCADMRIIHVIEAIPF